MCLYIYVYTDTYVQACIQCDQNTWLVFKFKKKLTVKSLPIYFNVLSISPLAFYKFMLSFLPFCEAVLEVLFPLSYGGVINSTVQSTAESHQMEKQAYGNLWCMSSSTLLTRSVAVWLLPLFQSQNDRKRKDFELFTQEVETVFMKEDSWKFFRK